MRNRKDKQYKIQNFFLILLLCVLFLSLLIPACKKEEMKVREPAVSEKFYPEEPAKLKEVIQEFFRRLPELKIAGKVKGIISPHAGYQFSGKAATYGYSLLHKGDFSKVIILGPSHYIRFHGCSIPNVTHYKTPLGLVELDKEICGELLKKELFSTYPEAHKMEHSIEVQLPFLQVKLKKFKLIPIVVGMLSKGDYKQTF